MATFRVLRLTYVVLGVYLVLVVLLTDFPPDYAISALLQGTLFLLFFRLGYGGACSGRRKNEDTSDDVPWIIVRSIGTKALVAMTAIAAAIIAAERYTGQWPADVLTNLMGGASLYNLYQVYNSDLVAVGSSVGVYALLLAYVKGVSMLCVLSMIARRVSLGFGDLLLLVGAVLAHVYIGVARGTNLEVFEVGLLFVLAIFARSEGRTLRPRTRLVLGVLVAVLVLVFLYVVGARGVQLTSLDGEVNFDPSTPFAQMLGPIAPTLVQAYGYLGFGSFVVGTYWARIWLISLDRAFAGMLPGGVDLLTNTPADQAVRSLIDIGVQWVPDSVPMMGAFGLMGSLALVASMGRIARAAQWRSSVSGHFVSYFVVLQMISFPLGGFLRVSVANYIIIAALLGIYAVGMVRSLLQGDASTRRSGRTRIASSSQVSID